MANAEYVEELIPESLRFGALALGVLPIAREGDGLIADFGPGQRHRVACSWIFTSTIARASALAFHGEIDQMSFITDNERA